ncbi:MAG: restriction endonuclease subunit S [Hassallia sp. WJT32-NPBG1]|jgi:type I restriction enzyme S subunit|nr:restriction endonuclease subunit S [Hassallia sp. WJT32-NPBG1]
MHNKTIPNDWVHCSLGDAITRIVGGGTPSRAVPAYWDGNIPWASVKDFSDDTQRLYDTEEHISSMGLTNSAANLIEVGTPIVCTRMAVGRSALAVKAIAINQDLKAIYPQDYLDAKYLLFLLNFIRPQLESLSIGSTVKGINVDQLLKIPVSFPSLSEQRRITEILDALDETIAHTSSLIAKLKYVKAGLLNDLLTRGLDENGELRDAIIHPEQFQDSPLGRIPKDWEVKAVEQILTGIDAGKSPDCPDIPAQSDEWGVLKVSAVRPDGFRAEENKVITNSVYINAAYEVKDGDLLITRANTYELVGLTCLVKNPPLRLLLSDKTLRLNVNHDFASVEFVSYILQIYFVRRQIERNATGSSAGMKNISQKIIRSILIPLPKTINEQLEIVSILNGHDERIRAEEAYRDKLKLQKKGLMDDLLTGRVRANTSLKISA